MRNIKKNNVFICFMGIDGSGKSSLANKTKEILLNYGIKSKYVWGGYNLFALRPIVKMARNVVTRKHDPFKDYSLYHSYLKKLGRRKFIFKIYKYLLLLEYLIEILIKIRIPLWLGKNIIADRYIFDTATNISSNYDFSFEEYKRLIDDLLRLCPMPDIVYFVDIPEEVALKRKRDIPSLEYLINRRKYYKKIPNYYNVITLDGLDNLDNLTGFIDKNIKAFFNRLTIKRE
ncbi:MAG: hypothetical protein J7L26_07225 [Candidatus Aminicenantes bacterium]|nr:hypothetical protein [Candidatus Aminicenantes bacterium]